MMNNAPDSTLIQELMVIIEIITKAVPAMNTWKPGMLALHLERQPFPDHKYSLP